jgi:hypothetical protein
MPVDIHIAPSDWKLIREAKKRGPKAYERVIDAIATRCAVSQGKRDRIREELMRDDLDRAWPPPCLAAPTTTRRKSR